MSSNNTYTLKIAIDDSKIRDLEKRLTGLMSGSALGGANPVAPKGGKNDDIGKNILKLAGIATGVAGLFMLVKRISGAIIDASPMLQTMLKLFNFSVMLILRPIGDFFGFFLRPLIIYFLRSVALPFYRQWRPIMMQLGAFLGTQLRDNLKEAGASRGKAIWEEGFGLEDAIKNYKASLLTVAALFNVVDGENDSFENMKKWIADSEANFEKINNFFTGIGTGIDGFTVLADQQFEAWKTNVTTWLTAWNPIMFLVNSINGWIAELELPDWSTVTNVFDDISTAMEQLGKDLLDAIKLVIKQITLGLVDLTDNNNNTTTNNSYMIDINGNGTSDLDEGWWKDLSDLIQGGKE
jgi:hypothetical protein